MTFSIRLDVALFDMDGVIFKGRNFWLELHRIFGTDREALDLAARLMKSNYQEMSEITVQQLWKDRSAEPLEKLVRERCYHDGVQELFSYLKAKQIRTAIVSSGPLQLAQRAQLELGIDIVRANKVVIEDGRIKDVVEIGVHDDDKLSVGLEVIQSLQGVPERTLFVGDTESDVTLAKAVAIPVAYNSNSEALKALSKHVIPCGELKRLISIIEGYIG